jgi:hypothetical protein
MRKIIRSSITEMKAKRNAEIQKLYNKHIKVKGSQRMAVAQYVADELNVNRSLVLRVTK